MAELSLATPKICHLRPTSLTSHMCHLRLEPLFDPDKKRGGLGWDANVPWHLQSKNVTQTLQTLAHIPAEQGVGWGGMLTFPTSQHENQIKYNSFTMFHKNQCKTETSSSVSQNLKRQKTSMSPWTVSVPIWSYKRQTFGGVSDQLQIPSKSLKLVGVLGGCCFHC